METALRRALMALVFLVPFIPVLVLNNLFFPFITGKNFAFRILVELAFGLWAILALRDPSMRPRRSALLGALLLFAATLGVSTMLAENPAKSFWSNFERMEGWVSVLHWGAYFIAASAVLTADAVWKKFWNVSLAVAGALGVFGIFQLMGKFPINQGGVRVDATFGNATYLAVYMLFSLFLTLLLMARRTAGERFPLLLSWGSFTAASVGIFFVPALFSLDFSGGTEAQNNAMLIYLVACQALFWAAWGLSFLFGKGKEGLGWYGVLIALELAMIYYTATRGTILGLIGGLFLTGLIFLVFNRERKGLRAWGVGAVIAIVALVGGFMVMKDSDFVKQNEVLARFASITSGEASTRFAIWSMALEGSFERPIFGWGQEGFNYLFNKYYKASLYAQEQWFDRAHNQYLDWLVAGGFFGFALYLSFYIIILWYLWRPSSGGAPPAFDLTERALLTGLLAGYAFHNLFVFDNLMSSVMFLSLMAYVSMRALPKETPAAVRMPEGQWYAGAATIGVATLAVLYMVNGPAIARASGLIEALKPHGSDITANFEYYKKALEGGGIGRQEAHEQLMQFAAQLGTNQNLLKVTTPEFRSQVYSFTAQKLAEEVAREPNDARVELFYASFLHQIGDLAGALPPLTKAHELSPQKQAIMFELGLLALDQGNAASALDWLRQAYELEPKYDQARLYYAMAAIKVGRRDIADPLLTERYGTVTPDNDYIVQAYQDIKDYASVLAILEKRVAAHPNDVQFRLNLAAGYLQAGRRQESVSALREAIRLDPSFAPQGEQYIQAIEAGQNPAGSP